jgi:hypothetical protein
MRAWTRLRAELKEVGARVKDRLTRNTLVRLTDALMK